MESVFKDCQNLISLDLSILDANPSYAASLFENCYSLETLKIPKFKTENLRALFHLFQNCYALKSLDLQSFTIKSATNAVNIFKNCYALTSINMNNFDV